MIRRLGLLCLLCFALAGCTGTSEIAPTTEENKNLSKEEMQKNMDDALNKMPADARAHYQRQ
jgi:hypothetical protein